MSQEKGLAHLARVAGVELVIFGVYAVFSISWASTGSLMPEISRDLGLNTQQATLITSMIVIAKIFGAAGVGVLIYRFGLKWGYFWGCLLISSAVFLSWTSSYWGILLVRFLMGLGSSCALVCLVPITQQYFERRALGFMVSFNVNSNLLGVSLGLVLAGSISAYFGSWRDSLAFYGWVNLALLALWLIVAKNSPAAATTSPAPAKSAAPDKRTLLLFALKSRLAWGMIVYKIGPVLFLTSVYTFLPSFYADYAGLSPELAATARTQIPALANFSMIFGPYLGLYFKRRGVGFKSMLIIGGLVLLGSGACMLFLRDLALIRIFAVITGLAYAFCFPFFFNLPSELRGSSPQLSAYIMSVFWTGSFVLLSFNLWFVSWTVDVSGGFSWGFAYNFALILASVILAPLILPRAELFETKG